MTTTTDSAAVDTAAPVPRRRVPVVRIVLPLLSVAVFLAVWQAVAAAGICTEHFGPQPITLWRPAV